MNLTDAQVAKIEEYIAFQGLVELLHWEDTSSHGFKVKLSLTARVCLDAFDNTMKRRKRRGGQRYHMILAGSQPIQMEAQFCGRGWAETSGAHIALHIPDIDDQRWFRGLNTRDQGDKETTGEIWDIILLEIGDDEIIINQTKRDKAYTAPVGGARSKAVAMMLQDIDFIAWLDHKSLYSQGTDLGRTLAQRDELMKFVCCIDSKIEFDNGNEKAWEVWENQFHRPFIQYMKRSGT